MSSSNVKHLASGDSRDLIADFVLSDKTGRNKRVLYVSCLNAELTGNTGIIYISEQISLSYNSDVRSPLFMPTSFSLSTLNSLYSSFLKISIYINCHLFQLYIREINNNTSK